MNVVMRAGKAATDAFGSVRTRIMAWVIVLTALAMTGAAGAAYLLEAERIDQRIDRSLKQEIDEFTSFQRDGVDPDNGQAFTSIDRLLEVALSRNVPDEHQTLAAFVGGSTMFPANGEVPLHADPGFREAVTSSDQPRYGDCESADGQVRFATMPVVRAASAAPSWSRRSPSGSTPS